MKKIEWLKNTCKDPADVVVLESSTNNIANHKNVGFPSNSELENAEKVIIEKCDSIFKELAK